MLCAFVVDYLLVARATTIFFCQSRRNFWSSSKFSHDSAYIESLQGTVFNLRYLGKLTEPCPLLFPLNHENVSLEESPKGIKRMRFPPLTNTKLASRGAPSKWRESFPIFRAMNHWLLKIFQMQTFLRSSFWWKNFFHSRAFSTPGKRFPLTPSLSSSPKWKRAPTQQTEIIKII